MTEDLLLAQTASVKLDPSVTQHGCQGSQSGWARSLGGRGWWRGLCPRAPRPAGRAGQAERTSKPSLGTTARPAAGAASRPRRAAGVRLASEEVLTSSCWNRFTAS